MNTNTFNDRINQFIEKNPKLTLQLVILVICSFWMSGVAVLSIILYVILAKVVKIQWWQILSMGALLALVIVLESTYSDGVTLKSYLLAGFTINKVFWKLVFTKTDFTPIIYLFHRADTYLLGFPMLI